MNQRTIERASVYNEFEEVTWAILQRPAGRQYISIL